MSQKVTPEFIEAVRFGKDHCVDLFCVDICKLSRRSQFEKETSSSVINTAPVLRKLEYSGDTKLYFLTEKFVRRSHGY